MLRRDGVGVEDAFWYAGRLTETHPITDRLDGFGRPGRIEACPDERPMVDLLREGFLDAIFTPSCPRVFAPDSGLRQVQTDFRAAEKAYLDDVGYVPGMHLISIKSGIADAHPWVAQEISDMLDTSQRIWDEKRQKYADTTPWLFDELRRCKADLPAGWNASGVNENMRMINDFAQELHQQGIMPRVLSAAELFPRFV
ncbi:hypothetical protein ACFSS8_10340 [Paracoccus kondratievae]